MERVRASVRVKGEGAECWKAERRGGAGAVSGRAVGAVMCVKVRVCARVCQGERVCGGGRERVPWERECEK